MQKIKMLVRTHDKQKGKIYEVSNNEAHALIDNAFAVLYKPRGKRTKDMRPENKKNYLTK